MNDLIGPATSCWRGAPGGLLVYFKQSDDAALWNVRCDDSPHVL